MLQSHLKNIKYFLFFNNAISRDIVFKTFLCSWRNLKWVCVCVFCSCFVFLRESLIRTAFQCLQLVVTDFLPTMPCTCLQIVVEVAGSFGLHNQELNISLTSIGLLVSFILTYSDTASGFFFFFKWKIICCQFYTWKPKHIFCVLIEPPCCHLESYVNWVSTIYL